MFAPKTGRAKIPGLMPNMSDDHLWAGGLPQFGHTAKQCRDENGTVPLPNALLRPWTAWLKESMAQSGGIVVAEGYASAVGVLKTEPEALDELVASGVREGRLRLVA
jgi:hypothetical protein